MSGAAPLAGVTVFENDSFVAAPSAALNLAQLGAEVIKIDPIGGGPDIDRWPVTPKGRSIYWGSLNRNKRSVAINLRTEAGQELAAALITSPGERSGVFVENNVGRPFLADAALRARREDLIHVKVQGSADGGPGVDYTVNAEVGIPSITGPVDVPGPVNHALPAWDLICGQAATTAVVTGLYRRAATGEGLFSEIALKDIALAAVANLGWLTETLQPGGERAKHGNHIFGSFGTSFATADASHVMVTAITRRQWGNLVKVTGNTDVIVALETSLHTDFSAEANRYAYRDLLEALLAPWFASRTTEQITTDLEGSGVLWAPYRTMSEVGKDVVDADASAPSAILRTTEHPEIETMITAANPIRVDGEYLDAALATQLGDSTDGVLSEKLGLTSAELGKLHDEGTIAQT